MSKAKNQTEEVATAPSGALAPYDYGQMAGRGFENVTQQDVGIPFLNLLQNNSPECTDGDPKQIKDARPGMFMDSLSKQLFDGNKGVILVPCATQHVFVEWIPRTAGGGFVGIHPMGSPIVQQVTQGKRTIGKLQMPTCEPGKPFNDLIETYYLFALMLAHPDAQEPCGVYVLGFTSTKIKHFRASIGDLRKWKSGVPLFAHRLLLTSWNDKNRQGQPFKNLKMGSLNGAVDNSLIKPDSPLIKLGNDLLESIEGGTAKVAHESASSDSGTGGDETADGVFK